MYIREYRFLHEQVINPKTGKSQRKKRLREEPIRVPLPVEPLVSEAQFLQVQERLNAGEKRWKSARSRTSEFEALGILHCTCGHKFYNNITYPEGTKRYFYYVCRGSMLKSCSQKVLRRENVDSAIANFVSRFFTQPEVLRGLLLKQSKTACSADDQQQRLQEADREIKRLNDQRARLLRLAATGQFPEEDVEAEAGRINRDINAWNTTIRQIQSQLKTTVIDENATATAIAEIFAGFSSLSSSERKSILNKFVSAIYVEPGGAIKKVIVRLPAEFVKMGTHLKTHEQFHETIDVILEPDFPFSCTRPVPAQLNEFGIPRKEKYHSGDVAKVLGISQPALKWRFCRGDFPEVPRDSAGRRFFSINDIRRLVEISAALPKQPQIASVSGGLQCLPLFTMQRAVKRRKKNQRRQSPDGRPLKNIANSPTQVALFDL